MSAAGTVRIGAHLGIIEDAEPELGYANGTPIGVMDACSNYVPNGSSRMAVRGGTKTILTLKDTGATNNLTSVLALNRYSQTGAALVGHRTTSSKHFAYLYDASLTTPAGSSPYDLGPINATWATATPNKVHLTELFEKIYIADASRTMGAAATGRGQLIEFSLAGGAVGVDSDFGGGAEHNKPFCIAAFNSVLFASGQDSGYSSAPAMVRHSFLGRSPGAANGFDKDAYNTIGAKGEFVTSMVPGSTGLLIAKENELYRLTGAGRGVEGWQYTVTPLDNTAGVGVKWPRAMTYAEGLWYGVGDAGPFVTDGIRNIDVVVRPRKRSWKSVISLDKAVVRWDPERRVVVFGIVTTGGTAVQTLWLWDVDRQGWVADWPLPTTIVDLYALPSGVSIGPTSPPTSIAMTHASSTLTSVSGVVTLGDSSASTEIWVNAGSGYYLDQILAPAATAFTTITAIASSLNGQVKARHAKDGVVSAYCTEVQSYTKLATPAVAQYSTHHYDYVDLHLTQNANLRTLYLKRNAVLIKTWLSLASGTFNYVDPDVGVLTCGQTYNYLVYSEDLTWPAPLQQSANGTGSGLTDCSAPH